MAQEGPTKAEINAVFKRLKSIPANRVCLSIMLANFNENLLAWHMAVWFGKGDSNVCLHWWPYVLL